MQSRPCLVKTCPALGGSNTFSYCPIHFAIANDAARLDQARAGKMGAAMKAFAEDIDRGIYPKRIW